MTTTLSRVADYSIILGGRAGVGKSSLYHRLIKGSFPEEPRFTSGHYEDGLERGVYHTHVNGDEVKVGLWDTGGLERYTSMTANYFRNCHAIVLVYSVEEEDSLFVLRDWLTEAQALNSERIVPALWGNKCESENACLTPQMAEAFQKENSISAELVARVSARTGEGVREAFEKLVRTVHSQFRGLELDHQRGRTLEPLIDPQLQKQRGRQCAC